jgi:hypothetical protein
VGDAERWTGGTESIQFVMTAKGIRDDGGPTSGLGGSKMVEEIIGRSLGQKRQCGQQWHVQGWQAVQLLVWCQCWVGLDLEG